MKIKEAREIIWEALKKDEDLHYGYISNIAMLLHDQYGITDYEKRNQAAKDILKLIFS